MELQDCYGNIIEVTIKRKRHYAPHNDDGLTEQAHTDSCDINRIMRRFEATGELPMTTREPQYGDATAYPDFQEACNEVARFNELFQNLPHETKEYYGHNPANYVDDLLEQKMAKEAKLNGKDANESNQPKAESAEPIPEAEPT